MNRVVVASVPAGHPYVRHLAPPGAVGPGSVVRLPDPDPVRPERPAGPVWWPPAMLSAGWVETRDFDLLHVHFGVDERTPVELRELVAALRRRDRPLVMTLHDLRSPHQLDPSVLDAQLDVLVPAADALLTLTGSAAEEVHRRWGRRPTVVPHPHLVDLEVMDQVRRARQDRARRTRGAPRVRRVGVAAKGLRANVDVARLLPGLLEATGPGVRLVVSVHREVLRRTTDRGTERLVARLHAARDAGELELVVHDPFDDPDLWAFVADLDVAVLPYRFGTHSGWLEMAHDLGTSVVAPTSGHYAGQGVEATYAADETGVDGDSLVDAVRHAVATRDERRLPGLDAGQRLAQRIDIAAVHEQVYAEALAAARAAA